MTILNRNRIASILCICIFFSCYEKEIACLDAESLNYTINADEACEDCCTYPDVNFIANHYLGDAVYHPDSVMTNQFGQKYSLESAYFFMHNFQFFFDDGTEVEVLELAEYLDPNLQTSEQKNDYIFVKTGKFSSKIGSFRKSGLITKIHSEIGVSENLTSKNASHILKKNDSLYVDDGYRNFVLQLTWGEDLENDKTLDFSGINNTIKLEKNVFQLKIVRNTMNLSVLIDYRAILDKVNFETISSAELFEIVSSSDNFITFLP